MEKKYWTGKELIEAGYLSAFELGELAKEGRITAWSVPGLAHYTDGEHYQEIKNGAPHSASVVLFPFDYHEYALEYEEGLKSAATAGAYQAEIESMTFENAEIMRELARAKGLWRPEADALLVKKGKTGRDIGRISMFNAIAAFNDRRVLDADAIDSLLDTLTEAGWKTYNKYMAAFFVLSKAAEIVGQFVDNVNITCQLLKLHTENALHENIDCPDCKSRRYDVTVIANWQEYGEKNKSLLTHNAWYVAWNNCKQAIICCAIERLMFRTAGATLNVPGLEAMLNKDIFRLNDIIKEHNDFEISALNSFKELGLPEREMNIIYDWTAPLPTIDNFTVPEKVMKEARKKLRLNTFAYDYNMLDEVFKPHFG